MENIKMKWNALRARQWLYTTGMDHITDGLYAEGGELISEANHGTDCNSRSGFKDIIRRVLWWDEYLIDEAIQEMLDIQ